MTLAQQLHNSASHAEGLDPACPICTNQPKPQRPSSLDTLAKFAGTPNEAEAAELVLRAASDYLYNGQTYTAAPTEHDAVDILDRLRSKLIGMNLETGQPEPCGDCGGPCCPTCDECINTGQCKCNAGTPTGETVDITPESLKTAEGRGKVAQAVDEWEATAADNANQLGAFVKLHAERIRETLEEYGDEYAVAELADLLELVKAREDAQEAMLRALAGR